jgi:hypothetical protein
MTPDTPLHNTSVDIEGSSWVVVELDASSGPRVVAGGSDLTPEQIRAEIPMGWRVLWGEEIPTESGGWAYPLRHVSYG